MKKKIMVSVFMAAVLTLQTVLPACAGVAGTDAAEETASVLSLEEADPASELVEQPDVQMPEEAVLGDDINTNLTKETALDYKVGDTLTVDMLRSSYVGWYKFTLDKSSILHFTASFTSTSGFSNEYPWFKICDNTGNDLYTIYASDLGSCYAGLLKGSYYLKIGTRDH